MRQVDAKMIQESRQFLDLYYAKDLSVRTKLRYQQQGAQYFGKHRKIIDTRSPRTYYLRKAALAFYAAEQLIAAGKRQDLKLFRLAFLTLQKLHTPLVGFAAVGAGNSCPIVDRARRKSKRKSLTDLPIDWRERMLEGLTGIYRDWLLLLSVTGLRPDEIANGVTVEPYLDGVKILIRGSKVKNGQGQEVRVIHSVGKWESELAERGCRSISATSANAVSQFVLRLAQTHFPRKQHQVSAYTYRHQVASDLKSSGLSGEQVSAILGHRVDLTQKLYGSPQQSRRPVSMKLISSSSPVRVKMREKEMPKKKPKSPGGSFSP